MSSFLFLILGLPNQYERYKESEDVITKNELKNELYLNESLTNKVTESVTSNFLTKKYPGLDSFH
jgi:hypothetical protein